MATTGDHNLAIAAVCEGSLSAGCHPSTTALNAAHRVRRCQATASKWMRRPRARATLRTVAKLGLPPAESAL